MIQKKRFKEEEKTQKMALTFAGTMLYEESTRVEDKTRQNEFSMSEVALGTHTADTQWTIQVNSGSAKLVNKPLRGDLQGKEFIV